MAWTASRRRTGLSDSQKVEIIYERTGHRPALANPEQDTSIFARVDRDSLRKLMKLWRERSEMFLLHWVDSELVNQSREIKKIDRLREGEQVDSPEQ
jgi:hypothetical protein